MKIQIVAISAISLLLVAACSGGKGDPIATSGPAGVQATQAIPASPGRVAATSIPSSEAVSAQTAPTPVQFFLTVSSPQDQTVVRSELLEIKGATLSDAVVSINGQPVNVDQGGFFTSTVKLVSGGNSVTVLASDFQGNSKSVVMTFIYFP